jgi:hypothetical protein
MARLPRLLGLLEYAKNRLRYKAPPDLSRLSRSNGSHPNSASRTPHPEDRSSDCHDSGQVLGHLKSSPDEGQIDDEFRSFIRKLSRPPSVNLSTDRLELALHAVHPDEGVNEAQMLGVLGKHGRENT